MKHQRIARILGLTAGATLAFTAFAGVAGAQRLSPMLEPNGDITINPCIVTQTCPPPSTTPPTLPPVDPCIKRTAILSRRCPPPTTMPPTTTTPPVTTPPATTPPATTPPEVIPESTPAVAVPAAPTFTG